MGINFNGYGPVYFEVGLIIFFDFLCSIICAPHPEVLAITNIGVKKSLYYSIITYVYRIDCTR